MQAIGSGLQIDVPDVARSHHKYYIISLYYIIINIDIFDGRRDSVSAVPSDQVRLISTKQPLMTPCCNAEFSRCKEFFLEHFRLINYSGNRPALLNKSKFNKIIAIAITDYDSKMFDISG